MRNEPSAIQAAGALLWRPSQRHGVRVAVVHRPRYGDWSLPKGKAESGESAVVTAAREVWEETGFRPAIGRALTTVSYSVSGRHKQVRYFAARAISGEFEPNKEVDRLEWLPVGAARSRMTYEFDAAVLDTFAVESAALNSVLLVRHARAGHRESFTGPDADRPLDAKGDKQAAALAVELRAFGPRTVHSAPVNRCRETVLPIAEFLGVQIIEEPQLTEESYRDNPAGARRRLSEMSSEPSASGPGAVIACSQGGVIPGVIKSMAGKSGISVPRTNTPKAAFWLLSFDARRLVQADPYPSPQV